jgi:hypothetical protein
MLTPREIIAQAWAITTTTRPLKRWGFFGSFFAILLDIKLLIYQAYFIHSYFVGRGGGLFDVELMIYHAMPFWFFITFVTVFIILVVIEIFVPSLSEGAIIGFVAKAKNKEPLKGGFVMALYNFFPILAVHEVFIFTSLSIFVTSISVILRYAGGLKYPMIVVAGIIWIISNILRFFSSFIEPAIVVDKMGIFAAGGRSVKLIFSYLTHVMFLVLLLTIITIRIFINTLIIILIPAITIGGGILLTYVMQPVMSIVIATIVGLILTFVAAYFFAYLHVFRHAVWTIMYMEITKEKDLDKIG